MLCGINDVVETKSRLSERIKLNHRIFKRYLKSQIQLHLAFSILL